MKDQKLVFDEVGIRLFFSFEEEDDPTIRNKQILEGCGCSSEGLASADYEKKAKAQIANSYLFHKSDKSLMETIGKKISEKGGNILEIGFGMGITADYVQTNSNISSHTIIEINSYIYEKALEWAKGKPNVNVVLGDWLKVLPTMSQKFDGIFHNARLDFKLLSFLDIVKFVCNEDAVIGFFRGPKNNIKVLNIINHQFTDEELASSPYFGRKGWDWSYTNFNGTKFIK
jgi:hypothetical protein